MSTRPQVRPTAGTGAMSGFQYGEVETSSSRWRMPGVVGPLAVFMGGSLPGSVALLGALARDNHGIPAGGGQRESAAGTPPRREDAFPWPSGTTTIPPHPATVSRR